ncbi:hypothetical protein TRVL_09656 [Trypanosoma vivax]|nr:hypothetical protein TRVL_09656 [Trypanosoma vivax]
MLDSAAIVFSNIHEERSGSKAGSLARYACLQRMRGLKKAEKMFAAMLRAMKEKAERALRDQGEKPKRQEAESRAEVTDRKKKHRKLRRVAEEARRRTKIAQNKKTHQAKMAHTRRCSRRRRHKRK